MIDSTKLDLPLIEEILLAPLKLALCCYDYIAPHQLTCVQYAADNPLNCSAGVNREILNGTANSRFIIWASKAHVRPVYLCKTSRRPIW